LAPRERRHYSDCRRERRNAAIDYAASWIHVSRRPRSQVELTREIGSRSRDWNRWRTVRKKSDQRIEIRLTGRNRSCRILRDVLSQEYSQAFVVRRISLRTVARFSSPENYGVKLDWWALWSLWSCSRVLAWNCKTTSESNSETSISNLRFYNLGILHFSQLIL